MTFPAPLPSRPVAHPDAVVEGDQYRITVLTDGLVRLEWSEDGQFEDRASTFALNRELPVPEFRVVRRGGHLEVVTSRFRLTYDEGPFTTSGLSLAVLGGISHYDSVWRFGQEVEDLGGTARTLDEADGSVPLEPGVVSRNGYAVIDDSTSFLFEEDGWVAPRHGAGTTPGTTGTTPGTTGTTPGTTATTSAAPRHDLYVFAYGHDYHQALQAFYQVSGPTPVLPRFALGNWWSRYYPYTADDYRALIERFEAEGLPFSVSVIDMDWHLVDVDPVHGSGWTGYTWNRDLFPDPAGLLDWLHEHGLRITLNVHPADGVRSYEDAYPAMSRALGRDPEDGEPIAFDVTDRAFLEAYFDVLHRGLEADGVDFWWLDWQQGPHSRVPGIDPLWMLNHFHYVDNAREDRRALTFSRYAGPGSHRYPVGFSGDTVISWASLAFQPGFTASASNIGYGWWSHDVGGHFFGTRDDELATRWVQLGVFSPIMRLHSGANPFITKEPWTFTAESREVMSAFLRLRHRLVPYLHTMNHRAAHGTPLVLPMYYDWPEVEDAYQVPHQYRFGTEVLVAPITEPADPRTRLGRVRAWLPDGLWVDLLSDLVYDGGRLTDLHRDLTTIPVLARAGAIVPLDAQQVPGNEPTNPTHLEVLVVVGADGSFELVEDDDRPDGATARTRITVDQATGVLEVHPVEGAADVVPGVRSWTVTFPALAVDEAEGAGSRFRAEIDGAPTGADVTRTGGRVSVTVQDVPSGSGLRVHLGQRPELGTHDVGQRVFEVLDRAQVEYAVKPVAHDVATADRPLAVRLTHLRALDLDPALEGALTELLCTR